MLLANAGCVKRSGLVINFGRRQLCGEVRSDQTLMATGVSKKSGQAKHCWPSPNVWSGDVRSGQTLLATTSCWER